MCVCVWEGGGGERVRGRGKRYKGGEENGKAKGRRKRGVYSYWEREGKGGDTAWTEESRVRKMRSSFVF